MNLPEVIEKLKSIYQIDPCGSPWVETDDIESAVAYATINGKGFVAKHRVEWRENTGYSLHRVGEKEVTK